MHLTSIRYQAERDGPWKSALADGSLNAVATELQLHNIGSDTTAFTAYEDGSLHEVRAAAVRLPDGRVYDRKQGGFIEEEKVHA